MPDESSRDAYAGLVPAFPNITATETDEEFVFYEYDNSGVSERLYLAVRALPVACGLFAADRGDNPPVAAMVRLAYEFADELLRQELSRAEAFEQQQSSHRRTLKVAATPTTNVKGTP